MTGPRRRSSDDHNHPEYWSTEAHHRFEDRLEERLKSLEAAIDGLTGRVTLMLGGLALIAFLLPLLAPLMRSIFNIPVN